MAFQYAALSDDFFEIRLLKIVPAENQNDPICVTVENVPLESEPRYWALSYTWGRPSPHFPVDWDDPKATACITVNGMSFQVRHNLHEALHMFRSRWSSEYSWWIDAICINQNDIQERNRQVSGMKYIYEKCEATVAWLGPADASTHTAFHKIASLAKSWKQRNARLKVLVIADTDVEEYTEILRTDFGTSVQPWEALRLFFQRFWWERSWVIQEVCLAPATIVQCDEYVVRWHDVQLVGIAITQHASSLGKAKDCEQTTTAVWSTFSFLGSTAAAHHLMLLADGRRQYELTTLLPRIRRTWATDPRDKVYAVLGMCRDEDMIRPDYSLCVNDVYMQIAKRSIETTQSFRILAHCRFPPHGLPSWVPDWLDRKASTRIDMPRNEPGVERRENEIRVYSASGQSKAVFRFEDHDRQLIANGAVLQELAFISTRHSYGESRNLSSSWGNDADILVHHESLRKEEAGADAIFRDCRWLREWAAFQSDAKRDHPWIDHIDWTYRVESSNDQFDKPIYLPSRESLHKAYLKTLFVDVFMTDDGHEHRISAQQPEALQKSRRIVPEIHTLRSKGRAFAVSESGLFLLVPGEAQVGDSIAFVQGSEVPFILRPWRAGYLFIGECYVHGLMDGLAWELMEKHRRITELRIL
ncbi:hypothetical protein LTR70_009550 [Exophiala xenobiotica]|uniref:Heterokaryon incompatibility domain-containing protein n=1 Tax=Lithohypha guttulata TaxID=1690604 RepID=A0ABR0JYJ8_9EURO|nr:hypothetical protein LTR24_009456 [Lithohypha guttulata]KAK5310331.1 hypothetical protein LTR70_009550 [Exophiala xenobiotica]